MRFDGWRGNERRHILQEKAYLWWTLFRQYSYKQEVQEIQVRQWTVKDAPRPGQVHSVINVASVADVDAILGKDRRVTSREIWKQTRLCKLTVHTVLHEYLHYRNIHTMGAKETGGWPHDAADVADFVVSQPLRKRTAVSPTRRSGGRDLVSPLNGRNQEPYHAMEVSVVPYIPQDRAIAQCLDGDAHIFILPQWATVIVNWHCLNNSQCCKILRNTVEATHVHNVQTSRSPVRKCNFLHHKASGFTANVTINTFTNWRWEALRNSPYSPDMYLRSSGLRAT